MTVGETKMLSSANYFEVLSAEELQNRVKTEMNDSGMTDSFERSENQQPNSNEQPDSQGNSQYTGISTSLHTVGI